MPPPPNPELRRQVIAIYKELLNLGKDYPQGGLTYFRPRLHKAFMSNAHLRDEDKIREGIARAEFVQKAPAEDRTKETRSKPRKTFPPGLSASKQKHDTKLNSRSPVHTTLPTSLKRA
ncbi:LYR family protein [Pyricularia oryzae Y34]|uniref:LYR family protein n=2 Tax=Pyricularia oryzae TaxID=318829 RepID=A0AA97NWJ0_PYRO3|nr:LYR family protein [Pyricularia oryzae Y34]